METSGPTSGVSPSPVAGQRNLTSQWRVGQLLQATVTENRSGRVLLTVGNRQIRADTSLPLEKGQQLTLQVHSLGERPVLKMTASALESPINSAIRLLLPKQAPMTALMATISQLARSPDPAVPQFIGELIRSVVKEIPAAETLAHQQRLKQAIAESGIFLERRLVQQLHQPVVGVSINSDFKANLLRLIQRLRQWPGSDKRASNSPTVTGTAQRALTAQATPPASPDQIQRAVQTSARSRAAVSDPRMPTSAPPRAAAGTSAAGYTTAGAHAPPLRGSIPTPQSEAQSNQVLLSRMTNLRTDLLQQADAALARLQLHQLAALPREGERGLLEWLFELPIRRGEDIDLWSMRIFAEQQEKQQPARQEAPRWSVQLAFDLPGLGPMQVQVQLQGEQVSARFWAEDLDTLPLLRENMHQLQQALSEAGLDVGELQCQAGPRPPPSSAGRQALIREKA